MANAIENIITITGANEEVDRFLRYVYGDWYISDGDAPTGINARAEGFNRLNDLLNPGEPCVLCCPDFKWEPKSRQIIVESRWVSVAPLLVAASRRFDLRFEIEWQDVDRNLELTVYSAGQDARWQMAEVKGGKVRALVGELTLAS